MTAPAEAHVGSMPAASARVASLLSRMTLDEKVGQMTQLAIEAVAAAPSRQPAGRIAVDPQRLRDALVGRHVGSLLNVLHSALPPDGWHALVRDIQHVALHETRLGVPVLYGIDFVHGANYVRGGTVFPHNVGLAAAFDPALVRRAAEVTACEAAACALPWNFAPVLDVGRQPLWPRFYETFGEDPHLAAALGAAAVEGSQRTGRVAATMKHYLGYGAPRSGRDRTPAALTEREVREVHLPPFRAAVAAGARALMVSSGDIDGEPVHASRHWLTTVLRDELGFRGVVVSDWDDVLFLHTRHRVARDVRDAVRIAVRAGVDMSMSAADFGFGEHLAALVRGGDVSECRVDESVRRILALKEALGLFDRPYPETPAARVGLPASRAAARDAARESITLLENRGVLPLPRDARLLVTGPAAHSTTALHGGWTYTWQGDDASAYPAGAPTLLAAIRARGADVRYVEGATFGAARDVAAAARAARDADVAIVALGENAYAEWMGDVSDLALPDAQRELARAVMATGTPTVIVLLQGRPRLVRDLVDDARAVVLGYWPGAEGAAAIAEVLFGDTNPSGRLPFTYPRHANALLTYDHRATEALDASRVRGPGGFDPEWPFGHGLSYTAFAYADLRLDREVARADECVTVEVTVTNTGDRAGREAVLLFARQHHASVAPPVRRLRAFEKIDLAPGASRVVRFALPVAELAYVGRDGRTVVEPGAFDVMVAELTATFEIADRTA